MQSIDHSPAADPVSSMLEALRADGPHPAAREALMLFGQFAGSWNVRVRFVDEAGRVTYDERGMWSFGWVLDGRAVQDVLVVPNYRTRDTSPGERGVGTTLRYFDVASGMWRLIWLGATTGILLSLTGRRVGDEIWVEGQDVDASQLRWMFTEISPGSFHWKGLTSGDDGVTWRLEQEMIATRSRPVTPHPSRPPGLPADAEASPAVTSE